MSAQSSMQHLAGTIITGAGVIGAGIGKVSGKGLYSKKVKISGKDIKMAAKARKEAQQKINAIANNREISIKAKTRRIGKVLDEYKGGE